MGLKQLTPPATMPITLAEAKAHLRVDHTDDDAYINGLIAAAVSRIDGRGGFLGRAIMTQAWRYSLDEFPADEMIEIPFPPLQSVEAATFAGEPFTYVIDVDSEPARLFASAGAWPSGVGVVEIDFTAGYANAAAVPPAIKHGMLLMIGAWYQAREQVIIGTISQSLPSNIGVDALLSPYRIFAV